MLQEANTTNIERSPAAQAKKPLHRVGSLLVTDLQNPKTIGERITSRRLGLKMSQQEVANLCYITQKSDSRPPANPPPGWTPRRAGDKVQLSRSAYCMYETDSVAPVLDVLVQIAAALKTTPEYIAFGVGSADPVEQVVYSKAEDSFEHAKFWQLDPQWLQDHFGADAPSLALLTLPDYTQALKPGDTVIVKRGVEPPARGEFVYALRGELKVGHITRPERAGPYKVYAGKKASGAAEEVEPAEINILGLVVGYIAEA